MIAIPYLIIGLLVFLLIFALKERQEVLNKLSRKCLDYEALKGNLETLSRLETNHTEQLQHLSAEVADSYMERLKLERQLEHLATGPNAIYRDNIRLQKELLAARTALLPQQTEELRKLGYLNE